MKNVIYVWVNLHDLLKLCNKLHLVKN